MNAKDDELKLSRWDECIKKIPMSAFKVILQLLLFGFLNQ